MYNTSQPQLRRSAKEVTIMDDDESDGEFDFPPFLRNRNF